MKLAVLISSLFFSATTWAAPQILQLQGEVRMKGVSYDITIDATLKKETSNKIKYVAILTIKNSEFHDEFTNELLVLKPQGDHYQMILESIVQYGYLDKVLTLAGSLPAAVNLNKDQFEVSALLTEQGWVEGGIIGNDGPGLRFVRHVLDSGSAKLSILK